MDDEATVLVSPDGTYVDASPAALAILGVTREQLLRMRSEDFAPAPPDHEEGAAFEEAWRAAGRATIVGETTIRRPDGTLVRVRFGIARQSDGRLLAAMNRADTEPDAPTRVFTTAGQALAAWRAAERRLETLEPGSADWAIGQTDVRLLRAEYQRLFDEERPRAD